MAPCHQFGRRPRICGHGATDDPARTFAMPTGPGDVAGVEFRSFSVGAATTWSAWSTSRPDMAELTPSLAGTLAVRANMLKALRAGTLASGEHLLCHRPGRGALPLSDGESSAELERLLREVEGERSPDADLMIWLRGRIDANTQARLDS